MALPHRKCSKEPADKEACSSLSEQAKHPRPACRKTLPQCTRPWAEEPDLSQALRLQQDNGPQNLPYRYAGASRTSIFGGEPVLCPPYPGPNLQKQPTLRHSFSQDAEVGGGGRGQGPPRSRAQEAEAAEDWRMGPLPSHLRNAVCLQKKLGLVALSSIPTQACVDAQQIRTPDQRQPREEFSTRAPEPTLSALPSTEATWRGCRGLLPAWGTLRRAHVCLTTEGRAWGHSAFALHP